MSTDVMIWDSTTGERLHELQHHRDSAIWYLTWTSDAKKLISGSRNGEIRIFDTATWNKIADLNAHNNFVEFTLLGNCRLASAPTLLDVLTSKGFSLPHFVGRTPRVDEELKRQYPNHHNYIQLRDLMTYHLAPSDLILFSALPSSLSFPVVGEILMTSQGPSHALRRLIPEVAVEPPGLTILIFVFPLGTYRISCRASSNASL